MEPGQPGHAAEHPALSHHEGQRRYRHADLQAPRRQRHPVHRLRHQRQRGGQQDHRQPLPSHPGPGTGGGAAHPGHLRRQPHGDHRTGRPSSEIGDVDTVCWTNPAPPPAGASCRPSPSRTACCRTARACFCRPTAASCSRTAPSSQRAAPGRPRRGCPGCGWSSARAARAA